MQIGHSEELEHTLRMVLRADNRNDSVHLRSALLFRFQAKNVILAKDNLIGFDSKFVVHSSSQLLFTAQVAQMCRCTFAVSGLQIAISWSGKRQDWHRTDTVKRVGSCPARFSYRNADDN